MLKSLSKRSLAFRQSDGGSISIPIKPLRQNGASEKNEDDTEWFQTSWNAVVGRWLDDGQTKSVSVVYFRSDNSSECELVIGLFRSSGLVSDTKELLQRYVAEYQDLLVDSTFSAVSFIEKDDNNYALVFRLNPVLSSVFQGILSSIEIRKFCSEMKAQRNGDTLAYLFRGEVDISNNLIEFFSDFINSPHCDMMEFFKSLARAPSEAPEQFDSLKEFIKNFQLIVLFRTMVLKKIPIQEEYKEYYRKIESEDWTATFIQFVSSVFFECDDKKLGRLIYQTITGNFDEIKYLDIRIGAHAFKADICFPGLMRRISFSNEILDKLLAQSNQDAWLDDESDDSFDLASHLTGGM